MANERLHHTLTLDIPVLQALQMIGFRNSGTHIAKAADEAARLVGDTKIEIKLKTVDVLVQAVEYFRDRVQNEDAYKAIDDLIAELKNQPQLIFGSIGRRAAPARLARGVHCRCRGR